MLHVLKWKMGDEARLELIGNARINVYSISEAKLSNSEGGDDLMNHKQETTTFKVLLRLHFLV